MSIALFHYSIQPVTFNKNIGSAELYVRQKKKVEKRYIFLKLVYF